LTVFLVWSPSATIGVWLSEFRASGSLGSFELSRLTMKVKFTRGSPDAKSWASTVTAHPSAGQDVAACAEVTDGATASAVRKDANTPRIATRAAVERPCQ
jgi:hypothetical protein